MSKNAELYETDFYGWTQDTARKICVGQFAEIDRDALAQEITNLGSSEEDRLERWFTLYLMHRLKWDYQPVMRSRSWTLSIRNHQNQARKWFRRNPSLKPHVQRLWEDAYESARLEALIETGLDEQTMPEQNPYPLGECFPEMVTP
jgi:HD-GYP domain-containing protein (c-di-GMP phosphodiesterase class II)